MLNSLKYADLSNRKQKFLVHFAAVNLKSRENWRGGQQLFLNFWWTLLAKKRYTLIWLLIAGVIVPRAVPGTLHVNSRKCTVIRGANAHLVQKLSHCSFKKGGF